MVRGFQSYFSHTLYSAALHLRKGNGSIASIFHTLEPVLTALLAFFLLGRILTALQWLGLGLIVVSVTVMQLSALLHSRKTPFAPDRVPAGEAR